MQINPNARYLDSHEYVLREGAIHTIGISDYGQDSLGDIAFVELPPVGTVLKKGAVLGVCESVKAASDLYAPVSGTVVAVNTAVQADPALINRDCYGSGWLLKVENADDGDFNSLLDAKVYAALLG